MFCTACSAALQLGFCRSCHPSNSSIGVKPAEPKHPVNGEATTLRLKSRAFVRLRAILVLPVLLLALVHIPSAEAAGCTKVNQVRVTSGTKFVCKKVGTRLEWESQRSTSVSSARPSAAIKPAPSSIPANPVLEWSRCSKAGATIGAGSKSFACLRFEGNLLWISGKTLSNPEPFMPCRKTGESAAFAQWGGDIRLVCTRDSGGTAWRPVNPQAAPALRLSNYSITGDFCHWSQLTPEIQKLQAGTWVSAGTASTVQRGSFCPANTSGLVAQVSAEPGTQVRFRVATSRWTWLSATQILGANPEVRMADSLPVFVTPASSTLSIQNFTGTGPSSYQFISYTESGDQSIFLFGLPSTERPITWLGASAAFVGGSRVAITSQVPAGLVVAPSGTFSISLKKQSFQFDLARLEVDFVGTRDGGQFAQRIGVNFTWR